MGIRYYAYPLRTIDIERANEHPACFSRCDPFAEAWADHEGPVPDGLDLDKSWAELQTLFGLVGHRAAAAAKMVEGRVSHTHEGWIPHFGVLTPDQMPEIAASLSSVRRDDVLTASRVIDRFHTDYVLHYLSAAQNFSQYLVDAGLGMRYSVG